jgi:hypothetical protein
VTAATGVVEQPSLAELVAAERQAQGLGPTVEDPDVLGRVAGLIAANIQNKAGGRHAAAGE